MSVNFDPDINIGNAHVILVGLGGTGSALARHVARTIYHMKSRRLHLPRSITFIDPDVVDHSNVGRQMFTAADVGQPKAQLLATRFNAALGLGIRFINAPFDAKAHVERWTRNTIILGAVDNAAARREIARAEGALWIDLGNHENAGQCVIGNTSDVEDVFDNAGDTWRYLPNAGLLFPDLLVDEPQPEPSCATLMEQGDQHLLINDMIAGIGASYFYKLALRQPIESFMTFLDGETLTMRSSPISLDALRPFVHVDCKRLSSVV